jgi:hypothetical protein
VAFGGLAVLAAIACVHVTRYGAALNADSALYISAGSNLSNGHGLTAAFNPVTSLLHPVQAAAFHAHVPLGPYGPVYPILIATLHVFGISFSGAERTIGTLSLIGAVLSLAGIASVLFERKVVLILLVVSICVAAPSAEAFGYLTNLLGMATFALSEAPFYAFFLCALVVAQMWFAKPGGTRTALLVAAIVMATLTRYLGASVAIACTLTCLSCGRGSRVRRAVSALGWLATAVGSFVGWVLLNKLLFGGSTPEKIAFHPDHRLLSDLLSVMRPWFFPVRWQHGATDVLCTVLILVPVLVALVGPLRRLLAPHLDDCGPVATTWRLAGWTFVSYLAILVVTKTWLDSSTSISERLLGPAQVVLYLLLFSMIYSALRRGSKSLRWSAKASVGLASAVTFAIGALMWSTSAEKLPSWVSHRINTSQRELPLGGIPKSAFIVSDDPAQVYLATGRPSILLPLRRFVPTNQVNPRFELDVRDVGRLVSSRHGYVLWVPTLVQGFVTPTDLEDRAGLVVAKRDVAGDLLLVARPGH